MKMYQRLGLSFLKPKVAPWRYNRGHRSLIDNLKSSGSTSSSATSSDAQRPLSDEDDDSDVPEEIEPLVGILLNGLRDKVIFLVVTTT